MDGKHRTGHTEPGRIEGQLAVSPSSQCSSCERYDDRQAGYVGRRASQSVGCGGRDAYAHMCMGRGVVVMAVEMVVVRA